MESFGAEDSWSLLNAAPDGVVVASETGEIVFVSDQAATLLGYEPTVLTGQSVDVLLPEALRSIHRAHRTRYRAEPTSRAMGAGLLLRARRSDGSEFPVEISLKPLRRDGHLFVVAAVRDVSDRVATEEHLHRVLLTLDASDDGVFIFDAVSLRYSYVNDGAVRLVGYHPRRVDDDDAVASQSRRLRAGVPRVHRVVGGQPGRAEDASGAAAGQGRRRRSRSKRPTAPPPTGDGGSRWIIALARDISARLLAEAELQRSQEALNAAERVVAIADDRERIARDLHDKVIQRLFASGLNLQAIVGATDDRIRPRIESTIDSLDDTIRELRMAIFSLQGSGSAPGGLRGQILDLVSDAAAALGFAPLLQFDGPVESIADDIAAQLVPTLREALSNVARHAAASSVQILVSAADSVTVEVIDDGVGLTTAGGRAGHGLVNLDSRARQLGGTFEVISQTTGGVRVRWTVPTQTATVDVAT